MYDLKDHPTEAWIAELQQRYPLDHENDAVLVRKLRLRDSTKYEPVSIERIHAGIDALLRAEGVQGRQVTNLSWLAGGASKLQAVFSLTGAPGGGTERCVVRIEPAASIVETSGLAEFQVLKALEGVLPAPKALWVDPQGQYFPYPGLIYSFAEGVTKPSDASSNVSGFGINFGPQRRAIIAPQFIEHLALLHRWDWQAAGMSAFEVPSSPIQAVQWTLNKWARVWQEDCNEDIPLVRYTENWLRENIPVADRVSMVHGDYRVGNFLFTEHDNKISAWLDWELAHLGDRHEDLALIMLGALGHLAEDGRTVLVGGIASEADFCAQYEKASGLSVSQKSLRYYKIFNAYRVVVNLIASAYRVAAGAKTHHDIVITWIMGLGYSTLNDLHQLLEEV